MNKWYTTSYIGVTNNLVRRIEEHRMGAVDGFSKRYHCTDLVYYEVCEEIEGAITREKELKGWRREKKVARIRTMNPALRDLASDL
jgi:putative endonuclease